VAIWLKRYMTFAGARHTISADSQSILEASYCERSSPIIVLYWPYVSADIQKIGEERKRQVIERRKDEVQAWPLRGIGGPHSYLCRPL
jgi:hypothetical protein